MEQKDRKVLLRSQQGELDAVLMYKALAGKVRSNHDAETFRRLATEEGRHATVFRDLTNENLKPKKTLAILLPILYKLLGKNKLYPIIARFEYSAVNTYAPIAEKYPVVQSVKDDEKRHGDTVMSLLG